jgi:hypothetical protein
MRLWPTSTTIPEWQAVLLALLLCLLCWGLAYQVPWERRLAVGGDSVTHRREDDAPFLHGFNASEPADDAIWQWWTLEPGYAYRWTKQDATVMLPGVGGGRWLVTLHASSGRPGNEAARSTWQVSTQHMPDLTIPASSRVYRVLAPADMAGNLRIAMQTPAYVLADDPRDLGFVLREVRIEPAAGGLRLPALAQLGWLAGTLLLSYGLLRWLTLAPRYALALLLAAGVLTALLLVGPRMALTLLTPTLAGLALACWALALVGWLLVGGWRAAGRGWQGRIASPAQQPRLLAPTPQFAAVLGLVLLAFVLRAGGMLHPHAIFSDHRLHANNILEVGLGAVYFTEGLPDSRGGGDAPYPPGLSLLLAPLLTVLPVDLESRVLLVQLGVALLDSLVLVGLWLLLRRAGLGQRAALLGAALYLLPPPLLASFSIGEYGNLGGQLLALPVLGLLALGGVSAAQVERRGFWTVVVLLALLVSLGLLGHLGVAISLALALGAVGLLALGMAALRLPRPVFALRALVGGGLLAVLFVGVFYYSAPLFRELFAARLDDPAGAASAPSLLAALGGELGLLFSPYSRLLPLTLVLGLLGLLLLGAAGRWLPRAAPLRATLLAWWLGTLGSFGLLLVAQQGVRWQHFLYPALCLGGGVALVAIWRRGQAGRMVALAGLLLIVVHGLSMWVVQVYDYLH